MSQDAVDKLAKEFDAKNVLPLALAGATKEVVRKAVERFGRLDVVFANAGISWMGVLATLCTYDEAEFRRIRGGSVRRVALRTSSSTGDRSYPGSGVDHLVDLRVLEEQIRFVRTFWMLMPGVTWDYLCRWLRNPRRSLCRSLLEQQ